MDCFHFYYLCWISNEIEKSRQYKRDDFVPNFIRTLQNQGYINIVISDDIQLQNGNHLVKVIIQDKPHYFITQYDGKGIIRTLNEEEINNYFSKDASSPK